jgi:hypothetical protein
LFSAPNAADWTAKLWIEFDYAVSRARNGATADVVIRAIRADFTADIERKARFVAEN